MVGLVEDLAHVTTQTFKQAGDLIYLLGETKDEFGGSELQKLTYGRIFGKAPELDVHVEHKHQHQVLLAIRQGLVESAHDLAEGGLAVAVSESLFGTELGAEVKVEGIAVSALFSESQSRFLLSVKKENKEQFESLVDAANLIGEVTDSATLKISSENETFILSQVTELEKAWRGAIPCLLK
jgi:phosphoribosylformylglycinamidine synthase